MSYRIVTGDDQRIGPWICARTGGNYVEGTAIGLEKDGELVAGVLYDEWNKASIRMHVAAEGKNWLNRDYLWFCFHYPFEQLKVRKLIGVVASSNAQALKFDKHLGFVEEWRISEAHPEGDLVVLTMTRQQCRYLERNHGIEIKSTASA